MNTLRTVPPEQSVYGSISPEPGYSIVLSAKELELNGLPAVNSPVYLTRDRTSVHVAFVVMLYRLDRLHAQGKLDSLQLRNFIGSYITAINERRLGNFVYDVIIWLEGAANG